MTIRLIKQTFKRIIVFSQKLSFGHSVKDCKNISEELSAAKIY